jgi:hypothetical protein
LWSLDIVDSLFGGRKTFGWPPWHPIW